jgi:UDP-glucose 4-epimerase
LATIIVTGGAGYVGAHACKRLARDGHVAVTIDNLSTGWRDAVRFGPFEGCDLADADGLAAAVARHRPDAILHFAAMSDIERSVADPALAWRANVAGTLNLLAAAGAAGVARFVLSSTCAVHGDQDGVLLTETSPVQPASPYARSKLASEMALADHAARSGMRYAIFRYFNVAGADEGREIGEFHRPETHLIPRALDVVRGRADRLVINGTDFPTPDGTCIRDFVHVEDLVDAHVAGLDHLARGGAERLFCLGSGRGYSVREVVRAVEAVTGTTLPVDAGPRRAGDSASLVCGSRLAQDVLGWQPSRSTLPRMIGDAWAWAQRPGFSA